MAIEFTNKPTKWENEGAEPSAELKKNGFQAGYKPPAGIFNHHWHEMTECIEELQTKVSGVDDEANAKVDKVSGKSLIDENVATYVTYNTEDHSLYTPPIIATTIYGDITLHKAEETHNLSEKANTTDVLTKTNTTEFTPTGDYNPATKKYVDDKVGSITVPIIDNLESDSTTSALSAKQGKVLDTAIAAKVDKVEMKNAFDDFLLGGVNGSYALLTLSLIDKINTRHTGAGSGGAAVPGTMRNGLFFKTGIYLSGNDRFLILSSGDIGTEDGDVAATVNDELHLLSEKVNSSDVLKKTNTTGFTPTGDYNPATKKYVDDKANTKVDKISGKGLSTNDFTSAYKTKLDNLDTNLAAKVINGSSLSTLTLTVSSTIPTTLAAGTICFIPEA